MSIFVDNITYLDTDETRRELEVTKPTFYKNVQPVLQVYRFAGKRKPYYKKADVLMLKRGQLVAKHPPIVISGILKNWTDYARSLGFQVDTIGREIDIVSTPENPFTLAHGTFVRRSRISFVNQVPICIWETYYPLALVEDFLEEMKADDEFSVVTAIKERRNLVVGWATERYTARLATTFEQELLQLLDAEPVLQLQRASYTWDKKTLILYSDMALLGAWFAPTLSYPVDIW